MSSMRYNRNYFLWLVLLFFLGCQKLRLPEESVQTVTLQFEGRGCLTKTEFGDKDPETGLRPVLWSASDRVGVTVNAGNDYLLSTVVPSQDARTASFSASLVLPGLPFSIQAVCPASAIVAFDGTDKVNVNIPSSQTPSSSGPDPQAQLIVSEITVADLPSGSIPLTFHHASAYACLSLINLPTEADVHSIDIVSSVPLSGKWDYSFDSGTMSADIPANIITLQTSRTSQLYFGCAPADLQGETLTIRLNTDEGCFERTVSITTERSFKSGIISKITVDMSGAVLKKEISILGIGNSFTMDAMEYLYQPLLEAGYTDIKLAYLFESGCSLQGHMEKYEKKLSYIYYKNTSGAWGNSSAVMTTALLEREWDYIVLQQASGYSGIPSSYNPYLNQLIDVVRSYRPKSKLAWHLTWAYQGNSTHKDFPKYGNSQIRMYNAIIETAEKKVLTTYAFGSIIPSGVAIQHLRESIFGDTLTRDGYHLSYRVGRFAASLMWCRSLGCVSIDHNSFTPKGYSYTAQELLVIKQSVESAFEAQLVPYIPEHKDFILPDPIFNPFAGTEESW